MTAVDEIRMEKAISEGADVDAYIETWMTDNEDRWQSWIDQAKNP